MSLQTTVSPQDDTYEMTHYGFPKNIHLEVKAKQGISFTCSVFMHMNVYYIHEVIVTIQSHDLEAKAENKPIIANALKFMMQKVMMYVIQKVKGLGGQKHKKQGE